MSRRKQSKPVSLPRVFLAVGAAWGVVGALGSAWRSAGSGMAALAWFLVLWAACMLDLLVLCRAVYALGAILEEGHSVEKTAALRLQAFFWGIFKLACLGIFGIILSLAEGIPTPSLLLGMGTIVVVAIGGGWLWSQRVVRNA